jgi:antitoxin component of RelBE/YafQ-DinJ toxin-antitoxin module
MSKITVGLKVDDVIWKESKKALADIGISRSAFVEMILESVLDVDKKPMKEVWREMVYKLVEKVKK